jgi:hypothetical protein
MARLRFDTQKVVVKIYALINLAYRQQPQLLKVTTLITSRSLTVTSSQPCKFTLTNQTQDFTKLILGSTNHVRVHAHMVVMTIFTLYKGCTRSPRAVIILGSQILVVRMEYPFTFLKCALGNHYKVVEWFHLACNIPIEV